MTTTTSTRGRRLPGGLTVPALVLRAMLVVLPCAALALALPEPPHPLVVVVVVTCSLVWARTPDHLAGTLVLAAVVIWWTVRGVVDVRVLAAGALLLAAHVVSTLLSYGPAALPVDPRLARLWLRRGLVGVVPLTLTWLAVRGLDPALAPRGLWLATGVITFVLVVVTLRLTQPDDE
jgi:hypothetical protein